MPTDLTVPDPAPVLDLMEAFRRSKTMFAAVKLGVFDALEAGPKPLAALAGELGANADALERLLDACQSPSRRRPVGQSTDRTDMRRSVFCRRSHGVTARKGRAKPRPSPPK
jgi:hypothetical protein